MTLGSIQKSNFMNYFGITVLVLLAIRLYLTASIMLIHGNFFSQMELLQGEKLVLSCSGEKLIDEPEFKASLFKQYPQAIGGEMEGSGLTAASIRVRLPWILVKSIFDWGDGNKHKKHQPLVAAAAVSLVHHVLSHKGALDGLTKR